MQKLKKLVLALTPMGAAAFVAGGGTFTSFSDLARWSTGSGSNQQVVIPPAKSSKSFGSPKKVLLALVAIGAAAYFAGAGTFASFSAETTNPGSSIASGTLTLNNQVGAGTTCFSYNGTNNVNPSCGAALTLTNLAPGVFGGSAKVTLTNSGSIDASKFYLYAPQTTTATSASLPTTTTASSAIGAAIPIGATTVTLNTALANALAVGTSLVLSGTSETVTTTANAPAGATSLSITATTAAHTTANTVTYPATLNIPISPALTTAIGAGQEVVLKSGVHTDSFQLDQAAAIGATSLHVAASTSTPSFSPYPSGSTVSSVDCYDARTTVGGTVGSTTGTDVNAFNSLASNPLCGTLLMSVQEVDSPTQAYCWSGNGSSPESAVGMCAAPAAVSLTSTLSTGGAITSLPLGPLNGNIHQGDTLTVTEGSHSQTWTVGNTAANNYYYSSSNTSVTVASQTPNFAYDTTATVVDTTELNTLNSDQTNTISNFDTLHPLTGEIALYPPTANGTVDSAAPIWLAHAGSRTFYINVYLPKPSGVNQNVLQGLSSTFGLTWHIDQ